MKPKILRGFFYNYVYIVVKIRGRSQVNTELFDQQKLVYDIHGVTTGARVIMVNGLNRVGANLKSVLCQN